MLIVGEPPAKGTVVDSTSPIRVKTVTDPASERMTPQRYLSQQWLRLGIEYHQDNKLQRAEQMYRESLWADPTHVHAINGIGVALMQQNKPYDAILQFERALDIQPNHAAIWSNLCVAYASVFKHEEARAAGRKALDLDPDNAEAALNFAAASAACWDRDTAVTFYTRSMELNPGLAAAQANRIFCIDLMAATTPESALSERRVWYERFGRAEADKRPALSPDRTPDRPLRVGYMTADCRLHSAVFCWGPVVASHDSTAVVPVMYNNMALDKSDDVTAFLRKTISAWHDVASWSDDQLTTQIVADRIDILVDLAGHSNGNRLLVFCRKPAPIAVTAFGYATGTGVPAIDYFLADRVTAPPEDQPFYVEQLIHLPSIVPYGPPAIAPPPLPLPAWTNRFITFGSYNRLEKCSPAVFAVWARILEAVPDSRLLLKTAELERPQVMRRLKTVLADAGIDLARVTLAGETAHTAHLAAFGMVDISLDPFPHTGGVTSLESLFMGVPVVSLTGPRTVHRLTASFLTTLGLTDWIASTVDDYVEIAVRAAKDWPALSELRAGLRDRMQQSPLRDPRYPRAVEAAYRWMWRRYLGLADGPVEHETIPAHESLAS